MFVRILAVSADGLLGAATAAGPLALTDRSGGRASIPALAAGGIGTWAPTTGTLRVTLDGGAGGLLAGLDYAFTFILANPARGQVARRFKHACAAYFIVTTGQACIALGCHGNL